MVQVLDNGYVHLFDLIAKGLLGFLFGLKDDSSKIIEGRWYQVSSFFELKVWFVCFDQCNEVAKGIPIWVKLPKFPLQS